MCLAIPGRVERLVDEDPLMPMARVRFGGVVKEVCLACVPEAGVGAWVLVHAGMAITVIDEARARSVLDDLGVPQPEGHEPGGGP